MTAPDQFHCQILVLIPPVVISPLYHFYPREIVVLIFQYTIELVTCSQKLQHTKNQLCLSRLQEDSTLPKHLPNFSGYLQGFVGGSKD